MKKKMFALILTIVMMISVMPNSFAYFSTTTSATPTTKAPQWGVTNCDCNIRSSNSVSSSTVGGLDNGTYVQIVGKAGAWYEVMYTYTCRTGYVRSDLIDVGSGTKYYVKATSNVNFRAGPSTSSTKYAEIYRDEYFPRRYNTGNWVYGIYATTLGYAHGDYVVGELASD